jgi:muramoyltetrapeptide carboxypeptidase
MSIFIKQYQHNAELPSFPGLDLQFHPQCFLEHGHFAGTDQQRLDALVECANDPGFDAVWFARGGYGSNRIAEDALAHFNPSAQHKTFLGYSDAGYLLGGLYARKIGHPVHASMPADLRRDGGEAAVRRVLAFLAGIMPGWNRRWMIGPRWRST